MEMIQKTIQKTIEIPRYKGYITWLKKGDTEVFNDLFFEINRDIHLQKEYSCFKNDILIKLLSDLKKLDKPSKIFSYGKVYLLYVVMDKYDNRTFECYIADALHALPRKDMQANSYICFYAKPNINIGELEKKINYYTQGEIPLYEVVDYSNGTEEGEVVERMWYPIETSIITIEEKYGLTEWITN